MPNCSFCNANLEPIDVTSGVCPVCGKSLTERDTIEFDDPSDPSPQQAEDAEENIVTVESDTVDFKPEDFAGIPTETAAGEKPDDGGDTVDLTPADPEQPPADKSADEADQTLEITPAGAPDDGEDSLQTLPLEDAADVEDTQTFPLPVAGDALDAANDEQESLATMPMKESDAVDPEGDGGKTLELDEDDVAESFADDDAKETMELALPDGDADDSPQFDDDDAAATLEIDEADEADDDAQMTMEIGEEEDGEEHSPAEEDPGLDSSAETMATMIVEISEGEHEGLIDEQFAADSSEAGAAAKSSTDGTPIDSIDESEQLATMPMEPGDGDAPDGGDSIDASEMAATHEFDADEATDKQVAAAFGEREGSSEASTQQTIISNEFTPDADPEQTIASNDLPAEVLKTMKAAWVSADLPGASPGMTVKAEDLEEFKQQAPETSLVIKLRRLVEADDTATAEAEYELVKVLGEGGMGVVYLARQTSIDRSVAIKMLKPKTAQDTDQRLKFLAEAVVTGDLDHPNIVPIYDVGSNDSGALFYSMKRVEGTPWLEVIKDKTLEENLDILDNVANAVSFAHARGVVHRDLKPENVMLGGYGEVLLMDWGLAQPTKDFSKSGSIAETRSMGGTPAYMAPEMATGPLHKIGPHSDIYLLGAILFEIITGKPPHRGANAMKCLMSAARNEIRPVEESGELMDIAMRAMAQKAEDRHASVKEFQDAIKEYLSHTESIDLSTRADKDLDEARESDVYQDYARSLFGFQEAFALWNGNHRAQDGISESRLAYAESAMRKGDFDLGASLLNVDNPDHAELHTQLVKGKVEVESRVRKLRRAKQAGFVVAAVFAAVLIGGGVWINSERIKAAAAAKRATNEAARALAQEKIANQKTQEALDAQGEATAAAGLAKTETARALAQEKIANQKTQEALDAQGRATESAKLATQEAARALQQEKLATASAEEAQEQTAIATYSGYIATIGLAKAKIDENAFDAARTLLEQYRPKQGEPDLRNWEWGRLMYLCSQEERTFNAAGNVLDLDVSRDGTRLVTALEGGTVEVWDLVNAPEKDGKPLLSFTPGGTGVNVNAVAFSPGGTRIAVGTSAIEDNVSLWDASTGQPPAAPLRIFGNPAAVRSFPDEHIAAVLSVRFSEDGTQLLTGSEDDTARVWDVDSGSQLALLRGHNWWVWDAAFSPNGKQIVTAGQDGIAIVWTYNGPEKETRWSVEANIQQEPPFTGHTGPVFAAAFSPDGNEVVTGGYDRSVLIWKPDDVEAYRWSNLEALTTTKGRLAPEQRVAPAAKARRLEGHIASVRAVRFFERESTGDTAAGPNTGSSANAAGNLLVLSSGDDGTVKVWNALAGTAIKTFRGHGSWVRTCAFAPDGQSVLSGSGDGTARQWGISNYSEIRELTGREFSGHGNAVLSASFARNNRNVVTASEDRTAKTWSDDGKELQTFREGHEFLTSNALFFPDGERLLTAAVDNTVRLWSVARGTELIRLEHTGRSAAVDLSPDGRWILTGSDRRPRGFQFKLNDKGQKDGSWQRTDDDSRTEDEIEIWSAKLWDARTGELVLEILKSDPQDLTHSAEVSAVAFSSDGKSFVTADGKGYGHLWKLEFAGGKPVAKKLHRLQGHTWGQRIVAARFLPDGSRVLTASADRTVAQWDVQTGDELKQLLLKHDDSLTAMDVAADGNRTVVLTSCADLTVRLWNADTARPIGNLPVSGGVAALSRNVSDRLKQLNREPQELWTETDLTKEDVARILNPNVLRKPDTFDETVATLAAFLKVQPADLVKPYITSVDLSADGREALTTNAEDSLVRHWDLATLTEIPLKVGKGSQSFLEPSRVATVEAAVFSPQRKNAEQDRFILTVGGNNAQLWDVATGREQIRYNPHGAVAAAAYSPDGQFIVTAGIDSTARIWNATTGLSQVKLVGHTLDVHSAMFSPDGKTVLTAGRDRTARLWDAADGRELKVFTGHDGPIAQAVFSEDGTRIATASDDGTARIWDVAAGAELARLDCRGGTDGNAVLCVAFSRDGKLVITGTRLQDQEKNREGQEKKAYAKIWQLEEVLDGNGKTTLAAREILYLTGHTAAVTSVAFSPDAEGSRALTGSEDYIVKLWDMRTEDDIAQLAAVDRPVKAPVPLQRGEVQAAQVVPPKAAKEILSLAGHQREVTSVAFSHDGQEVLTGSRDGKAILWLTIDWTKAAQREVAGTQR